MSKTRPAPRRPRGSTTDAAGSEASPPERNVQGIPVGKSAAVESAPVAPDLTVGPTHDRADPTRNHV